MKKDKFKEDMIKNLMIAGGYIALYSPGLLAMYPTDPNILKAIVSVLGGIGLTYSLLHVNIFSHEDEQRLVNQDVHQLKDIKLSLKLLQTSKRLQSIPDDTVHQIERLERDKELLISVLERKFTSQSLTYSKFLGIEESIEEAMYQNCETVLQKLKMFDYKGYDQLDLMMKTGEYRRDSIPDDLQIQKFQMYENSIESMKKMTAFNEELLLKCERLIEEISIIDEPLQNDILINEINEAIEQMKYYQQ